MTKVWVGVTGSLAAFVAVLGWSLWVAIGEAEKSRLEASAAVSAASAQPAEAGRVAQRLKTLDETLSGLAVSQAAIGKNLETAVRGIRNIERSVEDSDETIRCLDVAVPAALPAGLR